MSQLSADGTSGPNARARGASGSGSRETVRLGFPDWASVRLPHIAKIPRVAIIDSGYDGRCADLTVERSITIVDADGEPLCEWEESGVDGNGHGSACTAIVHALAPQARIVILRVFGRSFGRAAGPVIRGLLKAADLTADVALLCASTGDETAIPSLYAASVVAQSAGCIVVAAGDNAGALSLPAALAPVIGVGASRYDNVLDYEYHADEALEIRAHGYIADFFPVNGSGKVACSSSYAAATVAALIARIRSCAPDIELADVRKQLRDFSLGSRTSANLSHMDPANTECI